MTRKTALAELPYGIDDLDPEIVCSDAPVRRVRCFVKGCQRQLRVPDRNTRGDTCPDHGIRCFCSSSGATYAYIEARRNIIVATDVFRQQVIGHPFKYESHRLGMERSEDALTWNVFRSMQEAGCLAKLGECLTGILSRVEPFLFLWGICLSNDDFRPWHMLIDARRRFEASLPVNRPLTEPDIALFLPGKYLVLIEAKFTSRNTFYSAGPRKGSASLTLDEIRTIYHDPSLQILDHERALAANRIYHQLWRNTVFAEWMAKWDHPRTRAYHINLVRAGHDEQSASEFAGLIKPGFQERFRQVTWEQLYALAEGESRLARMQRYLETKTAGLSKAFACSASEQGV